MCVALVSCCLHMAAPADVPARPCLHWITQFSNIVGVVARRHRAATHSTRPCSTSPRFLCAIFRAGPPPQSLEEIQSRLSAKFSKQVSKERKGAGLESLFPTLPAVDIETARKILEKPVDATRIGDVDALRHNDALGIVCGVAFAQGKRDYQEDRSRCIPNIAHVVASWPDDLPTTCFFGMFDGHGSMNGLVGYEVAQYLQTHLAERLFAALAPVARRYMNAASEYNFCKTCNGMPDASQLLELKRAGEMFSPVAQTPALGPMGGTMRSMASMSAYPPPVVSPTSPPAVLGAGPLQTPAQYYLRPYFHKLITEVFLDFDKEVLSQKFVQSAGSTCTIATIFGDALVIANVGDSDAFLCRDGIARRLTVHHKAIDPQESRRIRAAGGVVLGDRVSGMLEVSRVCLRDACHVCFTCDCARVHQVMFGRVCSGVLAPNGMLDCFWHCCLRCSRFNTLHSLLLCCV